MKVRGLLGRVVVVGALAAGGAFATVGTAHADDCSTSATCGYEGNFNGYGPNQPSPTAEGLAQMGCHDDFCPVDPSPREDLLP